MTSILEVRELVKKYGDFTAVKGVSFDIKENEIFSLLGPNGAGKTTTISVLSTLYRRTSGDATIALAMCHQMENETRRNVAAYYGIYARCNRSSCG